MKKRIFFVILVLFLIFLNSVILMVSLIVLKDKFTAAKDRCLAEHYVIASSLIGDIQALEQRGNDVEENIDMLMRAYSRYLQGTGLPYRTVGNGFMKVRHSCQWGRWFLHRIQEAGRSGLSIWKMSRFLLFAFMEVSRRHGRTTD